MIRLAEYLDQRGNSPFGQWINRLNREAAAEVTYALTRLEHGYQSNVKAVGGGVNEYKITFGPGYRIYFGRRGFFVSVPSAWAPHRPVFPYVCDTEQNTTV